MKSIKQLFIWLTNLIPSIKEKRDRSNMAKRFINELESKKAAQKQARELTRNHPERATAYDYLFGFGFDPSDFHLDELKKIAAQTRANGWKYIDDVFIARVITGRINLEQTLTGGLDQALDIARNYNWGTITTRDLPGRNEICPCGSGTKFKKCCIKKIA